MREHACCEIMQMYTRRTTRMCTRIKHASFPREKNERRTTRRKNNEFLLLMLSVLMQSRLQGPRGGQDPSPWTRFNKDFRRACVSPARIIARKRPGLRSRQLCFEDPYVAAIPMPLGERRIGIAPFCGIIKKKKKEKPCCLIHADALVYLNHL